jgi:hypothetical protein
MVRVDFARRGVPWARLLLESGSREAPLNLAPRHRAGAAASLLVGLGLIARRPRFAAIGAAALIASNWGLYRLIWRRRGAAQATAAVGLHLIHHLTAVAAAGAGLARHLVERKRRSTSA